MIVERDRRRNDVAHRPHSCRMSIRVASHGATAVLSTDAETAFVIIS